MAMNVVGTVELQGGKAIMTLQPQQPQQPPDVTPPPRPAGVGENRGMDRAKWKRSIADSLQHKDSTHARAGRPPPQMV